MPLRCNGDSLFSGTTQVAFALHKVSLLSCRCSASEPKGCSCPCCSPRRCSTAALHCPVYVLHESPPGPPCCRVLEAWRSKSTTPAASPKKAMGLSPPASPASAHKAWPPHGAILVLLAAMCAQAASGPLCVCVKGVSGRKRRYLLLSCMHRLQRVTPATAAMLVSLVPGPCASVPTARPPARHAGCRRRRQRGRRVRRRRRPGLPAAGCGGPGGGTGV